MSKSGIEVKLIGNTGNAFYILGKVANALKKDGMNDLAKEYLVEAKSGDYDNLLCVTMDYVDIV